MILQLLDGDYVYRYRSKYRNRKADSDSSEDDNGVKEGNGGVTDNANGDNKGGNQDSLYHHSLSRFFSGIQGGRILRSWDNILVVSFYKKKNSFRQSTAFINHLFKDKGDKTKVEENAQTIVEPQPEPPPIKRYLFIEINLKYKVQFEDTTGEGRQKNPNPKYLLTLRAVRRSSLGRVLSLFLQVNISGVFSVLFCPEMVNIPSKSHQSHPIRKSVRFYFDLVQ